MKTTYHVVSFGGGVNGAAMLIGLTRRKIIVDYILFADTGGEKPATYAFISAFSSWLVANGQPPVTIVKRLTKDQQVETLEMELIRNKTIPPIAYGFKTCSEKYKARPQDKFVTEFIGRKKKSAPKVIYKYIGFDADESRRVKSDPNGKYQNVYPLIEWGWNRSQCIAEIVSAGLTPPPKSSCFFCPHMRKEEIKQLDPDLQKRALFMEQNAAPTLMELKGLGRRFAWRDLISLPDNEAKDVDDSDDYQIPCECID